MCSAMRRSRTASADEHLGLPGASLLLYALQVGEAYGQHGGQGAYGTDSNNTTGAIVAVRWDQWGMGWRKRITLETQRWPDADATQIVSMMRMGLVQRDTEATAESYNVGVA